MDATARRQTAPRDSGKRRKRECMAKPEQSRFAAKLLFGFYVGKKYSPFEERIVVVSARNKQAALKKFRSLGNASEYAYKNSVNRLVRFRFIGILDALNLNICETDEAWYDITETRKRCLSRQTLLKRLD